MRELDTGSCSARLQAGIFLIPVCPPEGVRYKNAAILSFHTGDKARFRPATDVAAEAATLKNCSLKTICDSAFDILEIRRIETRFLESDCTEAWHVNLDACS
jgi:hypothetical protein